MLIDDVAIRVDRRKLDIGNDRVLQTVWVDLTSRYAGDHFVLTDTRKRVSTECDGRLTLSLIQDLDFGGAGLDVGHTREHARCERARHPELQQLALGDVLNTSR